MIGKIGSGGTEEELAKLMRLSDVRDETNSGASC
jgi:hypothetical protein